MVLCAVACAGEKTREDTQPDAGTNRDAGVSTDPGIENANFLTRLEKAADLAKVQKSQKSGVKYLANAKGRTPTEPMMEACYFQNMNLFEWHIGFLKSFPEFADLAYETYLNWVLRVESRRFWGGTIRSWPGVRHPKTEELGIVAYSVYAEGNELEVDHVVEATSILKECAVFAANRLVFVPEGPQQKRLVHRNAPALEKKGVSFLFAETLLNGLGHESYSKGEGYGTLKVVPKGEALNTYGTRDIVVVESAPNDISIVAGLITKTPQNSLSHVNLRLSEKGIPSVAVPKIYQAWSLLELQDRLVHLLVSDQEFLLEPARLEEAEAFWKSRKPSIPPVQANLDEQRLAGFDEIDHSNRLSYGVKAANLGELFDVLPAEHRASGFAIPFSAYLRFIEENGIKTAIEDMLKRPELKTNAAFKRSQLKALRAAIQGGTMSSDTMDAIKDQLRKSFGDQAAYQRIRFRSSTNVEDLDKLTGAGLYDSKSGCLQDDLDNDEAGPSHCLSADERTQVEEEIHKRRQELLDHPERTYLMDVIKNLEGDLSKEKGVARAIRKVWASLWNLRAFDEREYYGVDHTRAFMGIAVNASFVSERASAVAITELRVDDELPLYRLSSQLGRESVVRPGDPSAIAESLSFGRSATSTVSDVKVQVWSSIAGTGVSVWSNEKLDQLGRTLFLIHDHFAESVYPQLSSFSLDVEIKHTSEGNIVFKQARPYVSFSP